MREQSIHWLSVADTISVIGYSLPETDTHIKEIIENGIENNNEYSLTIVNTCRKDTNKIKKILSNNSTEINTYGTFSEYLESNDKIIQNKK